MRAVGSNFGTSPVLRFALWRLHLVSLHCTTCSLISWTSLVPHPPLSSFPLTSFPISSTYIFGESGWRSFADRRIRLPASVRRDCETMLEFKWVYGIWWIKGFNSFTLGSCIKYCSFFHSYWWLQRFWKIRIIFAACLSHFLQNIIKATLLNE